MLFYFLQIDFSFLLTLHNLPVVHHSFPPFCPTTDYSLCILGATVWNFRNDYSIVDNPYYLMPDCLCNYLPTYLGLLLSKFDVTAVRSLAEKRKARPRRSERCKTSEQTMRKLHRS